MKGVTGWAIALGLAAGVSLGGTTAALGKDPAPGTSLKEGTIRPGTGEQAAAGCTKCRENCIGKAIPKVNKEMPKASYEKRMHAKNNYMLECNKDECDGKGQPCGPKE